MVIIEQILEIMNKRQSFKYKNQSNSPDYHYILQILFKVSNKVTKAKSIDFVLVLLLVTLNRYTKDYSELSKIT